ncbi:MAG: hypothetical protein ACKO0V_23865 [bacterium]
MADFELPPKRNGESDNPYAAPESDLAGAVYVATGVDDAEQIRNQHISAEASVRAIGTLDIIGAILLVIASVGIIIGGVSAEEGQDKGGAIGLGCFYLGFGILSFLVGLGLRRLKNWARITSAILCIPGIVSPITWLILYYLLNKKAVFVCTPEYAQIREMTPHIKYKSSIIVKVLLGLLLVVFLLIMAALISGAIQ